ncbi:MAG: DMT family transporter [candidate division Zixibacteria bacterium]|nr:DMT family transporter [candidate division Zixibacteria bacterium]
MSQSKARPTFNPLLLLIFGAVCISFAPVFVKLVGAERLGPTAMGFWRTLFGGLILFGMASAQGRRLILSRRLYGFSLLAGFIFFLDLFFWHRSVIYCGAGMSTILGNTQVFMTAIISFLIFKERPLLRFWLSAVSAIVGVTLLVGLATKEVVFTEQYIRGIVFGLATGIVYAHYLITMRWASHREAAPDILVFMAWTSIFSAFFLGVSTAIESAPAIPPDTASWLYLISLGLVAQGLGWWAITTSLAKTVASRAGLVLLLQPTLAMVWGVVMFSEQFTFSQAMGAVITLTAIYFGGLRSQKTEVEAFST